MDDNPSLNQPDQSQNQAVNPVADQPTIPLSNPAIPTSQPLNQAVNQPVNAMSNQPVGQSIKKWSELKDLAVVAIANGSKIGTLDDFYFDPSTGATANTVRGFRVKTGMFSHRVLPDNAINAIGTDAVTTDDEEKLIHEKDEAEFSTLPLGQSLLNYKIMSESGTFIGTIGNVLLDVTTPAAIRIYAFELSGGLRNRFSGHYSTFYAQQVIRYGQDVLVIPDAVGTELLR